MNINIYTHYIKHSCVCVCVCVCVCIHIYIHICIYIYMYIYIYIMYIIYRKIRDISNPIPIFFAFLRLFIRFGLMGWIWIDSALLNTLYK